MSSKRCWNIECMGLNHVLSNKQVILPQPVVCLVCSISMRASNDARNKKDCRPWGDLPDSACRGQRSCMKLITCELWQVSSRALLCVPQSLDDNENRDARFICYLSIQWSHSPCSLNAKISCKLLYMRVNVHEMNGVIAINVNTHDIIQSYPGIPRSLTKENKSCKSIKILEFFCLLTLMNLISGDNHKLCPY